jgi:hypothetical protein
LHRGAGHNLYLWQLGKGTEKESFLARLVDGDFKQLKQETKNIPV